MSLRSAALERSSPELNAISLVCRPPRATVALACFIYAGCSSTTLATGAIEHPATLSLGPYSQVLVAGGHLDTELAVLSGVVLRLEEMQVPARQVGLEDLEPMRIAGRIPAGSAVLILRASLDERTRPEWGTRPETVCGAFGCYTDHRTVVYDVPTTQANFTLVLHDGPTARVLRRITVRARDEGGDYDSMRVRVADYLIERIAALFSPRAELVRVELLEVDIEGVDAALEKAQSGDWARARTALEEIARRPSIAGLAPEDRARFNYDLGLVRRFDARSLATDREHFAKAERALREALRLHPTPRYERALLELRRHRATHAAWVAQRRASVHSRVEEPSVPNAPPAYQEAHP